MTQRLLAIAALLLGASLGAARAAEYKVIANPAVGAASVSADDLKEVFLLTRATLADGSHVRPVLAKSGPVHEAFLKKCIGKAEAALTTYYRSLVFTGKAAMPASFASEAEIVAYVARTKGAIGYVSSGAAAPGVKTLEVR